MTVASGIWEALRLIAKGGLMPNRLTRYQRKLLRFVAERAPNGQGFHATDVVP